MHHFALYNLMKNFFLSHSHAAKVSDIFQSTKFFLKKVTIFQEFNLKIIKFFLF